MGVKHYKLEEIDEIGKQFLTFMSEGAPTFLVVDDSGVNRKMIVRLLKDLHFRDVVEAKDGIEALLHLNKLKDEHVIMLLDLNMPKMDGLTCLEKIRSDEELKNTPVIIVSTETKKEKIIQAVKLGAAGYVVKPFTSEQINEKIQQLLS